MSYENCDCKAPLICVYVSSIKCFIDSDVDYDLNFEGFVEICFKCKKMTKFFNKIEEKLKPILEVKKKEERLMELINIDNPSKEEEEEIGKLEDEGIEI